MSNGIHVSLKWRKGVAQIASFKFILDEFDI